MKLLKIQIPMSQPGQTLTPDIERELKRAAFEELCALIPALGLLKNTTAILGTSALENQIHLSVLLSPVPQLSLRLSDTDWQLGRVVELDAASMDQVQVRNSLLLTRDLLAAAQVGEPEAVREWLDRYDAIEGKDAFNRRRRYLGERYAIEVFDTPEVVSLPTIEPTRLEDRERSICATVTKMKGRTTFWAWHLTEIPTDDGGVVFDVDCRQVWAFVRRGQAQSYDPHGKALHESMERGVKVILKGRLVIHEATGSPVAMEVERVDRI